MLDCGHSNQIIQKKLESIYALHTKKMNFNLGEGHYRDLLTALGDPHLHLPKTIHVAGTNGKGSTIAFLKSMLESNGMRVHAYTSPHLIKFNERITVAGHHIDDETLLKYLNIIDDANKGRSVTFFEYTTALAFKIFADIPADICLLETGLGGRLDCTNVIPTPIATIITAIGYDHMDWLGTDIKTIAAEKAGIMKHKTPCFIAPQNYDVNDVFQKKSQDINCPVHFTTRANDLPSLGLVGNHQKDNASVAIHALSSLGLIQNEQNTALKNTQWPARMEHISQHPNIWFDCGHNVDGAKIIANQLQQWKSESPDRAIHVILGLATDKNPDDFLAPIIPFIDKITCVDLLNARNPQTGHDLAKKISIHHDNIHAQSSIKLNACDESALTLITGSLYLYDTIVVSRVRTH